MNKVSFLFFGLIIVAGSLIAQPTDYIAYYPFSGNANDESANALHGNVVGASLTADRFGNSNSAYAFDGNGYIDCGASTIFDLEKYPEYTISVWIKPDNTNLSVLQAILSRHIATEDRRFYLLFLDNDPATTLTIEAYHNGAYETTDVVSSTYNTSWQHVLVIADDGKIKMYVDQVLVSETSITATMKSGNSNTNFVIGAVHHSDALWDRKFEGIIDDVHIYSRALSDSERSALYANTNTDFLSYSFTEQVGPATVDDVNHTIDIEVGYGTDLTALISTFTLSAGASAKVNLTDQISGTTVNDFTNVVTYTITAEDGSTTQVWTVTVSKSPPNSETDITALSFTEQTGSAVIDNTLHTISINVSPSADLHSLIATFVLSQGASAKVNDISQVSGATSNDFYRNVGSVIIAAGVFPLYDNFVVYEILAEDGVSSQLWRVRVNPELDTETDILSFSLSEQTGSSTIDVVNHTIDIEIAFGTDLSSLIPTFTLSESAVARANGTIHVSGVTASNFTSPFTYHVTSSNGIYDDYWNVTVTTASSNMTDITAFSLSAQTEPAIIDNENHTIEIEAAYGSNVTSLTPAFSLSYGAMAKIASVNQVSGTTSNDFSSPVTYSIVAEDGSTIQDWVVSVSIAPQPVPTISSFSPANGPIGTEVTITGTNFDATPANNIVFFGAAKAAVTAATSTSLTVTVPAGATYEPITVLVDGLIAYSQTPFVVTFEGGGTIDANSFDAKVDYVVGTSPNSVSIGDLDGDGKSDLAIVNLLSKTVSIFRNTSQNIGSVSYATKDDFLIGDDLPTAVSFGDLNGDGKTDMVVANSTNSRVAVFKNTSESIGSITFASKVEYAVGESPYAVAVGDLDGDGRVDLVVTNLHSNTISVLRNTSSGTDAIHYDERVDYSTGTQPYFVSVGDLDNDGKVDLVTANGGSNTLSAYRNVTTGAGDINFATKVDFETGSNPRYVSLSDLDSDDKIDMAVANSSSTTVSVFRNTSTNAGSIDFSAKVDFLTGDFPYSVSIGDLSGDGKADLVVANAGVPTVSVMINQSTDIGVIDFDDKVDFTTGTSPRSVSISDLDGDGKSDLVVGNFGGNSISILRNTIVSNVSSTDTDFLSYIFPSQSGPATFDTDNHTISIEVASGTDLTSLVATFTLSSGATTKANGTTQISGTTANDFSSQVNYTVTSEDGSTSQVWTVTVTVAGSPIISNIIAADSYLIGSGGYTITATITDNVNLSDVQIFAKKTSETDYTATAISISGD
ncbi:FG-GAP-like repeat-containing protein, partial [Reichenbachiella sp.]|uniref:FG-GAP-like repeat-containing protein n=2 Tax=Reichenbachiella sp. TaxID=2184521 RepID=UPI00329A01F7